MDTGTRAKCRRESIRSYSGDGCQLAEVFRDSVSLPDADRIRPDNYEEQRLSFKLALLEKSFPILSIPARRCRFRLWMGMPFAQVIARTVRPAPNGVDEFLMRLMRTIKGKARPSVPVGGSSQTIDDDISGNLQPATK